MNKISIVFTVMTCTVFINLHGQDVSTPNSIATEQNNLIMMDSIKNVADYQNFKADSEEKLNNNNEMIVLLKDKFSELDTYKKFSNQKKVAKLERRNIDLNEEFLAYNGEIPWEDFKIKFMNELNQLHKELTEFRE